MRKISRGRIEYLQDNIDLVLKLIDDGDLEFSIIDDYILETELKNVIKVDTQFKEKTGFQLFKWKKEIPLALDNVIWYLYVNNSCENILKIKDDLVDKIKFVC